jgi:hypothetical protein
MIDEWVLDSHITTNISLGLKLNHVGIVMS